jgi:hypothetical protein
VQSISITVGRGGGERQLDIRTWRQFKRDVRAAVKNLDFDITVANQGQGSWEGITEQNYHVQGIRPVDLDGSERAETEHRVRLLAKQYEQDAIAWSVGRSELIEL